MGRTSNLGASPWVQITASKPSHPFPSRRKPGEELGTLGDIPAEISAEPHLHLALTKEGKAVDPAEVLVFQ